MKSSEGCEAGKGRVLLLDQVPGVLWGCKRHGWLLLSSVEDNRGQTIRWWGGPTCLLKGPQPRADKAQEVRVTEELIWPAGQTRLHT